MNTIEKQIYENLTEYIKRGKLNRSGVLASLKKELRTKSIVDLVFDHPDIFRLDKEISFVPRQLITTELLVKLALACPKSIDRLDDYCDFAHDSQEIIPILLAFWMSITRYDYMDYRARGSYAEKIAIPSWFQEKTGELGNLAFDFIFIEMNQSNADEIEYPVFSIAYEYADDHIFFNKTYKIIERWIEKNLGIGKAEFELGNKKLAILISGLRGVGKRTLAQVLQGKIANTSVLSEDELFEHDMIDLPLKDLTDDNTKVVIFTSDIACCFFEENALEGFEVVNIVVEPRDLKSMFSFLKNREGITIDEFKNRVLKAPKYEDIIREDTVVVQNDFDGSFESEANTIIAQITEILGNMGYPQAKAREGKAINLNPTKKELQS